MQENPTHEVEKPEAEAPVVDTLPEGNRNENAGLYGILVFLQIVLLLVALVAFVAFLVAIFGLPARVAIAATFIDTLVSFVPQFLPAYSLTITDGTIYPFFAVIFVVALLLDWPCAQKAKQIRIARKAAGLREDMRELLGGKASADEELDAPVTDSFKESR